MKYSEGFRNAILRKVLPSNSQSVYAVAKEAGISAITIHSWLSKLKDGSLDLHYEGGEPAACTNAALFFHKTEIPGENDTISTTDSSFLVVGTHVGYLFAVQSGPYTVSTSSTLRRRFDGQPRNHGERPLTLIEGNEPVRSEL